MRPALHAALVIVAALALSSAGSAQDTSLPDAEPKDPQGVIPDQRLEVVNKEMAYAAERLDAAAATDNETARSAAFEESQEAVNEVRALFRDLPPDQRTPYEQALLQAEEGLRSGDPTTGAAAMRELRQRVLDLVAGRS